VPTVQDIREGFAANLRSLDGYQVSPYMLTNFTPPVVWVARCDVEYDRAMGRGLDYWTFTIQAVTGLVVDVGAQQKIDQLLAPSGATSVKQAIESDKTLGGLVPNLTVLSSNGYRQVAVEGLLYLLAEWTVELYARGV
jgi:hypothetical protein